MKTNILLTSLILLGLFCIPAIAQNITTKSNEVSFDFRNKRSINSSVPKIAWVTPMNEVLFTKEGEVPINFSVTSRQKLKSITLKMKTESDSAKNLITVPDEKSYSMDVSRTLHFKDGVNQLEVWVENVDGVKIVSRKTIHAGATTLADASKLKRTDYALVFATDSYDNWKALVNPIFDGRSIANELEKVYSYKTELVENPTQENVLVKLREYAEKNYEELDQLFIFFAGHGFYDDAFKEGFVVTKESLPDDPGRTSYLAHSRIRSAIVNNPCKHVFLAMDVCFGGTIDEKEEHRGDESAYEEASQSELIIRKLKSKTRKYLTSGGKEYVSDGVAGKHSPFAKQFLEALKSRGGNDGILTLTELITYVENLKTAPKFGQFGTDQPGSDFLFIVK